MASADAPWLLGASGQVGYFLQQRCGDALVPCVRSVPRWATDRTRHWRLFDLWRSNEAPTCARLISAGPLDACIDWLSRSGPGALQRIVALSSMSVLHKQSSTSVQERDIAQRLLVSERRLSEFAAAHGIACTILRPTLIWGAGMDHSLTPYARAAARRGYAWIPSGATGLRQPVHADDLAALCVALTLRDDPLPGVFEAGGGERLTLAEMLTRTARSVGARAIRVPAPGVVLASVARIAGWFGIDAAALARARQDQCTADAAAWQHCGIAPRQFVPGRDDWFSAA
jgi:hypothetical protein